MSDYDKIINILNEVEHKTRRNDAIQIVDIIRSVTKVEPRLWNDNNPGFGDYHYVNKTNEGDMPILSLAVAKAHVTIYFAVNGLDPYQSYLSKLGQYRRGKICLYISNMKKINVEVFRELVDVFYKDALAKKTNH